jgi:hypothetical protein
MIRLKYLLYRIYDLATIPELAFASTVIPDEPELIITIPLESAVPPVCCS